MNATIGIVLVAAVKAATTGYDHLRVAGYDLSDQIGIALVMPLGGIAFDDQVISFDITQPA